MLGSEPTSESKRAPSPLLVENTCGPNVRGLGGHERGHVVAEATCLTKGTLCPLAHTVAKLLRGGDRFHVRTALVLATPLLGRGWGFIRRVARIQLFSLSYVPASTYAIHVQCTIIHNPLLCFVCKDANVRPGLLMTSSGLSTFWLPLLLSTPVHTSDLARQQQQQQQAAVYTHCPNMQSLSHAHDRSCNHSFLTLATPGASVCSSISAASSPDPDVRLHSTAAAILLQKTRCASSGHLYKYGCRARREHEQPIGEKARGGPSLLGRAHEAEELPREPLT